MWYPSKKEVQDWIDLKEREFIDLENINPCLTFEALLQKYIFTDQYEIFFASFPIKLYEWISRLIERKNCFKNQESNVWTPKLIQRLKSNSNQISKVVDF